MTEWTLDLGAMTPLSLNGREHWRVRAKRTALIRAKTAALCQLAEIPALEYAEIELHYAPRDRRRRDAINCVGTLKAAEDGCVDAEVIPDDTPRYLHPLMPIIDPPTGKPGRMYLIIREVQPERLSDA